ncbi:MAG: transposase domain-containing protein [Verrucomicrobia bacterium]|nr:transposase domain-containing protein [Verrucomicrobiota bacterium]
MIANCRLHGVEPWECLKDVLTRLPDMSHSQVRELTPLKWKANREKPTRRAASVTGAGGFTRGSLLHHLRFIIEQS